MRNLILLSIFLFATFLNLKSQQIRINPHAENQEHSFTKSAAAPLILSNDTTFDVHFYHLDLEISVDSAYLKGSVNYLFTSLKNGLQSIKLDLDNAYRIDSISNSTSYSFANNVININLSNSYNLGDTFSFTVYYQGIPQLLNAIKGLRYETHNGNEPIIASLSTPYLAHTWWPCKDGLSDKADSTFIDITIKDTIIDGNQLMAVSNGLLDQVVTIGKKKKYKWKHYYPVVPYYVMVAISNFNHFQQTYVGTTYSFPIDYYVFNSHLTAAQAGVADVPIMMDFFTNTFGPYPFLKEKYAMTQLGYYGGIENQTNSIVNNMGIAWKNVTVHELAHQWFADMITCNTWNHGWLNEGFASYSEALFIEYQLGFNAYQNYVTTFEYYLGDTIYINTVSDPFKVFKKVIYDKGAYVLHMLRGVLGDSTFFKAIKNYATDSNHQYGHATTEDFQLICENTSGQNLNYFFDQWIYDARYPVYGYNYNFDTTAFQLNIAIQQTQGANGWRSVFEMPMEIRITFNDFTDTIVKLYNNSQTQQFAFTLPKIVNSIQLDPNQWILKTATYDPNIFIGLEELSSTDFVIYPNPARNQIFLKSSSINEPLTIRLRDLSGKLIQENNVNPNQNNLYSIDLNHSSEGIYLLEIQTKHSRMTKMVSLVK
jgi:aminopeptidase N